jgi:hypothetical protein
MSYPYEQPPTRPVPCVHCFHPTTNHRAVYNFEWSGEWDSMCRDQTACNRRAAGAS